jgi:hypothetical protein
VRNPSVQSCSLHCLQNRQHDLAREKAPQSISSPALLATSEHLRTADKDYCAKELAHLFGKHVATIYRWFESVPDVTPKKNSEPVGRGKRRYRGLSVPQSVLIKFMKEHNIKIPS